jgi:hypothetical protein
LTWYQSIGSREREGSSLKTQVAADFSYSLQVPMVGILRVEDMLKGTTMPLIYGPGRLASFSLGRV